jgi:hypothetical protein
MVLTWGPQFTQIYDAAYAKLIGSGHPAALGNDIRIRYELAHHYCKLVSELGASTGLPRSFSILFLAWNSISSSGR